MRKGEAEWKSHLSNLAQHPSGARLRKPVGAADRGGARVEEHGREAREGSPIPVLGQGDKRHTGRAPSPDVFRAAPCGDRTSARLKHL